MTTIKIAALDDNPTHLQMVEQALIGDESNWSLPVEFKLFSSGEMLLQELKKVDYDCVILDRVVPDMSGDVILNWLHQYRPNRTGVVMLTKFHLLLTMSLKKMLPISDLPSFQRTV